MGTKGPNNSPFKDLYLIRLGTKHFKWNGMFEYQKLYVLMLKYISDVFRVSFHRVPILYLAFFVGEENCLKTVKML